MEYLGSVSIDMGDGTYRLRRPAKLGGEFFANFDPSNTDSIDNALKYVGAAPGEHKGVHAEIRFRREVLGH